jgi:hypothetical protein
MAKQKYDATYGAERPPLPQSIDDQAEFFFQRGELATIYLRTYVDHDAFAAEPNSGHFAAADLLLIGAITTAVSTNIDMLIEIAGNTLFGHVGAGVSRMRIAALPPSVSPLLKVHGCWSDPAGTVWAPSQVAADPIRTRIEECGAWLTNRLLDRDLVIVGYWTDWDYLAGAAARRGLCRCDGGRFRPVLSECRHPIARETTGRWLSRSDAVTELGL